MTRFEKLKEATPKEAAKMFYAAFGIKKEKRLCVNNKKNNNFHCDMTCEACIQDWLEDEVESEK